EFHINKFGNPLTIKDLNLKNKKIEFEDTHSSRFELVTYKDRNYLLGDNSCYPCSIVYNNVKGNKWVNVLIVPDGNEITLKSDFPIIYNFIEVGLYKYIDSMKTMDKFLDSYKKT